MLLSQISDKRTFECLECLHSYSCVVAMLIAFILFVSRHYETLHMQLVFSLNVIKLTSVELQQFSRVKPRGSGRGIMLGGLSIQASGVMDALAYTKSQ